MMDDRFAINKEKILNSALFILDKLEGKGDLHKIFKILYFADQKHLVTYGFPITGDVYVAMENGPVPSNLYDVLKALRGDNVWSNVPKYTELFDVENYHVSAKRKPDIKELAESDVECLLESIQENKNLGFKQLKEKSHQIAWENAKNDESSLNEMNFLDIAREGGAGEEMMKYILLNLENQTLLKPYAKPG